MSMQRACKSVIEGFLQKKRTNEQAEVQDQGKEEQGEKGPRES